MMGSVAAFEYFLKIDGIAGESTDSKHKDEIDVQSWSWGETHSTPAGGGGGGGAGKVQMQDLHVTAKISKASPQLMLACASGKHIKSAILTGRRSAKVPLEFLTFSLSDVLVSSYQTGGTEAEPPVDAVSLNFAKIQIEYKELQQSGKLGGTTKAGWDVKQNKQF
jgi:type VI secretion system secreted protein Hcp